jgi:hypothetical protein
MSTTYASKAEIAAILTSMGMTVVEADVSDNILYSSKLRLDDLTGTSWGASDQTIYIDGKGHKSVMCPNIPINTLTSVTVIAKNEDETSYDLSGDDRQIWWDGETGLIQVIKWDRADIAVSTPSEFTVFPVGVKNVKIVGNFGRAVTELVKLAQALLAFKQFSILNPETYPSNLVMEKIGNYQYKLAEGKSPDVVTFDAYINQIIEELKNEDSMVLEEI